MGTLFTLGAASRQLDVSKTTLRRAIRAGQLTAGRRDNWVFQIDSSELARYALSLQVNGMRAIESMRAGERQPGPADRGKVFVPDPVRHDTIAKGVIGMLKRFKLGWSEPREWSVGAGPGSGVR